MNNELTRAAARIPLDQLVEVNAAINTEMRSWSILLTSANYGTVGPVGSTFPHAGEKHERVLVVEVPAAAGAPSDQVNLKLVTSAGAAQPVGEFQGYVDGEPFVAWADRTRMPQVGDKLYAGAAPVAAQAGQVAPADLHGAIMNIQTDPSHDAFTEWVPGEREAYLLGHRDARHAAAELAAGAAAGQVAVPEMTDAQIVAVWQGMPGGPEGWLKQFGYLQFARALLAAAPSAPAVIQQVVPVRLQDALDSLRVVLQRSTVTIDKIHELGADGPLEEAWQIFYDEVMPALRGAPAQAKPLPAASQDWRDIGPLQVVRDENGWWTHPAIPNFDEDHSAYKGWLRAVGLEVKYKMLDSYPEHPLYEAWFDRGECNASSWEPEEPNGEGWFTFSIHDTEDGPVWVWARRIAAQASTPRESQKGGAA